MAAQHLMQEVKNPSTPSSALDELRKSFVNTLVVQINTCPTFGAADATKLCDGLKGGASPYGEAGTQKLMDTIDAKQKESQQTAPATKKGKKKTITANSQLLKHIWNYPTQPEWDILFDKKKQFSAKMATLVHRLMLVGCIHPDEQTL